ncbi:MAG: phospho-sugar mutase, partial [Bacteroidales bacterium]
ILEYILSQWKEQNRFKGNEYIVKTIVTTELLTQIAKNYNVEIYDTLTGFKFIAEIIRQNEGKKTYIAGGEESYGYLIGDFVRDKDAVTACAIIAEIAVWAKEQGKNLLDILIDIYMKYGFYKEGLVNVVKKGKTGADEIQEMMKNYRSNPPVKINGEEVNKIIDYKSGEISDKLNGTIQKFNMHRSNVLQIVTTQGTKISVRPSGTEPKIKFYFSVKENLDSPQNFDSVNKKLDEKIHAFKTSLGL